MADYCLRCGREAELLASTDGSMLCQSCILVTKPHCIDCIKCHQRKCGDAIYACPFCHLGTSEDAREFDRKLKERLQPVRIEEKCERCGGTLPGLAFILHGKTLCRNCLIYEQDRWEIVSSKPGKYGTRVKVVIERPRSADEATGPHRENPLGRKLFHAIGVDPGNPPPDPFKGAKTMDETRMPDGSCVNCEAYRIGKAGGKHLGINDDMRKAKKK
jgi:hypothetical protein